MEDIFRFGEFHEFYIPEVMMRAIRRYIINRVPPGDFLTAVICNDLVEAVNRADEENRRNLPAYVAYFYNEAPGECCGSLEKMGAWLRKWSRADDGYLQSDEHRMLTAENAQIQTVTVAVRTMVIGRRQVTLSIFRQLIEEDIVDRDVLKLHGVGWGHMRYLIEQPPDRAIHLVWQKGSELRRCIVQRYMDRRTKAYKRQWDIDIGFTMVGTRDSDGARCDAFYYVSCWEWIKPPRGKVYDSPTLPEVLDGYDGAQAQLNARNGLLMAHKQAAKIAYRDEVREALQEEYDARCAWCDQYEALVKPLFDLPQLFIGA